MSVCAHTGRGGGYGAQFTCANEAIVPHRNAVIEACAQRVVHRILLLCRPGALARIGCAPANILLTSHQFMRTRIHTYTTHHAYTHTCLRINDVLH